MNKNIQLKVKHNGEVMNLVKTTFNGQTVYVDVYREQNDDLGVHIDKAEEVREFLDDANFEVVGDHFKGFQI